MHILPAAPSPFAWFVLAIFAVAATGTGAALGFELPMVHVQFTIAVCVGLLGIAGLAKVSLKSGVLAETFTLAALWLAMLSVLSPASYVAAGFNAPVVDGLLSRMDQAIGFDWVSLQRFTDESPWVARIFTWIYGYSVLQVGASIVVLTVLRQRDRLNTFVTGLLLATIATILLSAILPAAGAYRTYGVSFNPLGQISLYTDPAHYLPDFDAVRAGTLRSLDIPRLGIIQFPSYHTVQTVMAAWATWHMRWVGPFNVLLTGAVLVTTLPIGGHHLMDIAGGALVSALCLAIAARVEVSADDNGKKMHTSALAGVRTRAYAKPA